MSPSSASSPNHRPTARFAGGRVALASDARRVVVAMSGPTGGAALDVALDGTEARAWAARVAAVLEAHPPAPDVTPVELRTPWLRGDDGEPALAIERVTRGPQVRWRLLLRARGGEASVALGEAEVPELLRRLTSSTEPAREVG